MQTKPDFNPWKTMWTKPAETVRKIVNFNPRYGVVLFCIVAGLLNVSSQYILKSINPKGFDLIKFLSITLIIGLLTIPISSLAASWIGKKLGGKARYIEVRAAVAWSYIVQIPIVLLNMILIPVVDYEVMPLLLGFFAIILGVWSFWMLLLGYAEVQMFSKTRAFWGLIFSGILSTGMIALVVTPFLGLLLDIPFANTSKNTQPSAPTQQVVQKTVTLPANSGK